MARAIETRLARLEARRPLAADPVAVLRLLVARGEAGPVIEGATWCEGAEYRHLARRPGETCEAFKARAWAAMAPRS